MKTSRRLGVAVVGALALGLAGIGLTALAVANSDNEAASPYALIPGMLIGMTVGGIAGSAVQHDRWESTPLP